jgi:hypothetical protein
MTRKYKLATEAESFQKLLSKLSPEDQLLFDEFGRGKQSGHFRVEPVFIDRVFYLYECMGRNREGKQLPPKVHGLLKVINMHFTLDRGFEVTLLDEISNTKQVVGHQPAKLLSRPVFVSVPNSFTVRWNLLEIDGKESWDAALVLYIKCGNKSEFFSKGNFYLETPAKMRSLYPEIEWAPDRFEGWQQLT